jgi:hypothetical protein
MSEHDLTLAALWAEDEPPASDHLFVLETMERVERRRFWLGVLSLAPVCALAGLVLWALAPMIAQMVQSVLPSDASVWIEVTAAALTALCVWFWATDRLQPLSA